MHGDIPKYISEVCYFICTFFVDFDDKVSLTYVSVFLFVFICYFYFYFM